MSKLTDEQINTIAAPWSWVNMNYSEEQKKFARAIEAAATEPLLQRIAELEDSLSAWRRNAELADNANRELERQLEEASKDAERWRTFLSTRPQSTHEVIIQAIDDAAMQKDQS